MRRFLSPILVLIAVAFCAAAGALQPVSVLAQNGAVPASSSESSLPSKDPPADGSATDPRNPPASSGQSSSEQLSSSAESSQGASAPASSSRATFSSSTSPAPSKSSESKSSAPASSAPSSSSAPSRPSVASSSLAALPVVRSSSSKSSAHSSVVAAIPPPEPPKNSGVWDRGNFGYGVPVIDPAAIARPESFSLQAMGGNALLALLITLVIGLGGELLRRLAGSDPLMVRRLLIRLPLQAMGTILLIELYEWLVPTASAQGFPEATAAELLRIPLFAFLFLVVTGVSNGLLNALAVSEGGSINARLTALPGIAPAHAFFSRKDVSRALWFVLLLLALYGIVGAYINPQFSLFPSENLGIVLVAVAAVAAAAYLPDVLRYAVARRWECPAWFEGNITGLLVALLCVYLSRKFQLSPGYIYGLPVGLFLILRGRGNQGLLEFLSLTWMLVIAVAIWLLLPVLSPYAVLYDVGNLLFIVLLEGVFFELLPLPSIAGGTIFRWRRPVWAVQFLVVVFLLFQTLFHPQGTIATLQQSPSAVFTLLSAGFYALGVMLLWGYVLWARKK